jgi:hypothetical protein
MNTVKGNSKKEVAKSSGNPFVKAIEDKKKTAAAIQEGKSLRTFKDIKLVKPI